MNGLDKRNAVPDPSPPFRRTRLLPVMIVALVAFMGISSVLGLVGNIANQSDLADREGQTRDARVFQTALMDATTGVRGYVGTGDPDYLSSYLSVTATVDESPTLLRLVDRYAAARTDAKDGSRPFSDALADLRTSWQNAIRARGNEHQAEASLETAHARELADRLRGYLTSFITQSTVEAAEAQQRIYFEHIKLLIINMTGALIAIATMVYAFYHSGRQARDREAAIDESNASHERVEQLFFMTDMLQSAADQDDTNAVLRAAAGNMLPGFSGAMYAFNNSRDRLDLTTRWGTGAAATCTDHFSPTACWALKRGKANLNLVSEGALRCSHVPAGRVSLEIPIAARGELHGLIEVIAEGEDAAARLAKVRPIAAAIGDAMSLALSGMALRERLRNQALRDSLTGLYNRRFLEETLERLCLDSERRKSPMSCIMIDLDHFKRLNDTHGHAAGDSVLRETAKAIVACLRATDVACRYGGEELTVLLPDCPLNMAEQKAEQIRAAIAEISAAAGLAVTASFGVASHPETSTRTELLSAADGALYVAKQNGRNRVEAATLRASAQRLTVVEGGHTSAAGA